MRGELAHAPIAGLRACAKVRLEQLVIRLRNSVGSGEYAQLRMSRHGVQMLS